MLSESYFKGLFVVDSLKETFITVDDVHLSQSIGNAISSIKILVCSYFPSLGPFNPNFVEFFSIIKYFLY